MSIEVSNISKHYGAQKALDNVSFSVKKGEIVGFLGPNGAGKSTLMKILTTYISADEGTAVVNGNDVNTDAKAVQLSVGYLPEHNPLYLDLYIREYLEFNAGVYNMPKSRVDEVIAGSAAENAGLKPGDFIRKVDGSDTRSFGAVQEIVFQSGGQSLPIVVERAGSLIELTLTPRVEEMPDGFGGKIKVALMGVRHNPATDKALYERYSLPQAFAKGIERTWYIIATTGHYVGKLFTGNESIDQIGGPIAMAKGAGDTASSGGLAFISFVALLSVSIGLINLFPVPMLDGGHLAFYAVEALRGKPLGPNAQEWGYRIGFSFVVMLMLIGIWNDVVRMVSVYLGS